MREPIVSIAIASYNAARHLEAAVRSALDQHLADIEVIIVDDVSSDDSAAIAQRLASEDSRVIFDQLPENRGPAGARNRALALARGRWFAVLDSDDIFHPSRLSRLIDQAEKLGADVIADDLILFDDDGMRPPTRFLGRAGRSEWITLPDYFRRTVMYGPEPDLGFLKPVIRLERMRAEGISYDERLRIAEDDDLAARMLIAGMRYRVEPFPTYLYRKHSASISHRLSTRNIGMILASSARLGERLQGETAEVRSRFRKRHAAHSDAYHFARFIDALKARNPLQAVMLAIAHPGIIPLIRMPIEGQITKLRRRLKPPRPMQAASENAVAGALAFAAASPSMAPAA